MDFVQDVHNIIGSMKNPIQQSKVWTIRKLIKNIKQLKDKKGSPEQIVKNLRKAERLEEEKSFITDAEARSIAVFALKSTHNIEDGNTLIKRAMIRLVLHKTVKEIVQKFRSKYPEWKEKLPSALSKLGQSKSVKKKRLEKKQKNKSFNQEKLKKKMESKKKKKEDSESHFVDTLKSLIHEDRSNDENDKSESEESENESFVDFKKGEMEVRKINLDEFDSDEEIVPTLVATAENPLVEDFKTESSFFLGGASDDDEDEEEEKKETQNFRNSNYKEKNRQDFTDRINRNSFIRGSGRGRGQFSRVRGGSRGRGGVRLDFPKNSDRFHQKEKMHPSWEAKRKNSGAIADFSGKKIKFDDHSKTSQTKLHPSWSAKKEIGGSIKEFKGKKTVFSDD